MTGVQTCALPIFVLREGGSEGEVVCVSDEEASHLLRIVSEASQALAAMRESEGLGLAAEIGQRLSAIEALRSAICTVMEGAPKRLRERMEERLKGLAPEVKADPERLALEVALLADRVDVSEEIARLDIHFGQFRQSLAGHADGETGRAHV